jgi:uncharacterized protein
VVSSNTSQPGVGVLFNPSLDRFVERSLDRLDYLAVIPDRAWIDRGVGMPDRFQPLPLVTALLDQAAQQLPIVLHSIGLSIGSADIFDEEYAKNLLSWAERLHSPWISEHLSFSRITAAEHEVNSAIALPVPYDREILDLLIPRIQFVTDNAPCPFLLENSVYYFSYPDQEFSEEVFLNELCNLTQCRMLLDLHNLYTNAVNHSFDPLQYLAKLDLANVREIHIAGGIRMMGFHTDSHTGPVMDDVWSLLEHVIPLTPNLAGVTFEFHESSFSMLGEEGILEQVDRAKDIVNRHVPSVLSASAR